MFLDNAETCPRCDKKKLEVEYVHHATDFCDDFSPPHVERNETHVHMTVGGKGCVGRLK